MSWFDAALLSTAAFGVAITLDSHILSRRMPSLQSYLLVAGLLILIGASVFLIFFPLPEGISVWVLLVALTSGILRSTSITFILHALRREEVAQVVPIFLTYPVFVAIMAVPLLGEILSSMQWLAIFIVVTGAVLVSFKKSPSGSTTWLGKMFLILLSASLLNAMADVTSKYVLAHFSFWNMFIVNQFCFAGVWLTISVRPHVFKELSSVWQRRSTIALIVVSQVLAPMGILLLLWAMERGPVSLVSTIAGSRPIFVAVFALILSRISPKFIMQSTGKGIIALRLIATAIIVVGISIIYLT